MKKYIIASLSALGIAIVGIFIIQLLGIKADFIIGWFSSTAYYYVLNFLNKKD